MTDAQRKLRTEGRCIGCAAPLSIQARARKFTECLDCWKTRNRCIGDPDVVRRERTRLGVRLEPGDEVKPGERGELARVARGAAGMNVPDEED